MKAVRFHEYGDVSVLRYEEAERPRPGAGEVLVKVAATAFNPVDTWFRSGQALFEHGALRAGQRVLLNGADGGVGGFAVQLASQAGAYVIATASPRSAATVHCQGADEIIDYAAVKVSDAVRDPVDLVVNLVPGSRGDTEMLLDVTRTGGILVSATSPGGQFPGRDVRVVFFSVRSDPAQLAQIIQRVEAGQLRLDITGRRPLADTRLIHEHSQAGAIRGRVVLIPEG